MYESAYHLSHRPFAATPDAACFFACETNSEVFHELVVCLERGQGIGILTGAAGVGKTLLCRRVLKEVADGFQTVFIGNSNFATRRAFLQAITYELGDDYSHKEDQELRLDLRRHLQQLRPERQALALVIDEAHLFPDDILEEIRVLADLSDDDSPLVRVILSGQLNLEERLTERAFDALNQRIATHVTLEPLSHAEAMNYVEHRLQWAGAEPAALMTTQAIRNIARASGGVPRCIHQLADHSLMLAHSRDECPVQANTIVEALQHLKRLPLQWNDLNDLSSFSSTGHSSHVEQHIDDVVLHFDEADELLEELELEESGVPNIPEPDRVQATQPSAETATFEFGSDNDLVEPSLEQPATPAAFETSAEIETAEPDEMACEDPTAIDIRSRHQTTEAADSDSDEGFCLTLASPRHRAARPVEPTVEAQVERAVATPSLSPIQHESSATEWNFDRDDSYVETLSRSRSSVTPHRSSKDRITEDFAVVQFEEEIVVDHYAALQEPEFSGIIWNLARKTETSFEPRLMVEPACEPCHSSTVEESVDHMDAPACEAAECVHFDANEAHAASAHAAPHFEVEYVDEPEPVESEDEVVAEEFEGYVEDIRPVHPERYIDAIMPMLEELLEEDGIDLSARPEAKTIEDVEADMFDAISIENPEIEDRIGTDVLDLVFDTQAALRSSQDTLAKTLERQLEDLNDEDGEIEEKLTYQLSQFDVVLPEDDFEVAKETPVRDAAPQQRLPELDQVEESATRKRPYGRLFTDLRRRHPRAG